MNRYYLIEKKKEENEAMRSLEPVNVKKWRNEN